LTLIHPTAIVDKAAEIDPTVEIGPNVIIEGPVRIGPRTKIMANAYLSGHTEIGADNIIHIGAVVGHTPQHLQYKGGDSGVKIGDRNTIREYVTIHRAYLPGQYTTLGNDNFLMATSHVGHDTRVGNRLILANCSLLAGHTWVEDNANISGNVAIHQYVRIGKLAMIGGLSRVSKDVPPFMVFVGDAVCGINTVGLRRAGFDPPTRDKVKQAYKILYRSGLNVPNAVKELEESFPDVAPVKQLIEFIRNSARGISKHASTEE
jgi:UDP-N-acetylglucosamine acyltransferase